jgi:flavin-dependent dehydrogenase
LAIVRIAGAGLAGSAAALAASRAGAAVRMWDPSRLPRNKVCGEFLTPEIEPVLASLGLWDRFLSLKPARMTRTRLIFDGRTAEGRLPETAFGLSRLQLDVLLRGAAQDAGAEWITERAPAEVDIIAHGRQSRSFGRDRLFGFKAHFLGVPDDAVELHFFDGVYVGVNPVENGVTNVCGLGLESRLRRFRFDYDSLTESSPSLRERLRPLRRSMDWLSTGPVRFESRLAAPAPGPLLSGDALQFVDPFTGTGMSIAIWTGALAGRILAEGRSPAEYYDRLRAGLSSQSHWCARLRRAVEAPLLRRIAHWPPPSLLYHLTRPRLRPN